MATILRKRKESRVDVNDILHFITENDSWGRCFVGWPKETLFAYLQFHSAHDSLYVTTKGGEVTGVAVAWRLNEENIGKHWIPPDRSGDSLFISDIVCSGRDALRTIFSMLGERIPDWESLRIIAERRGEMVNISMRAFNRLRKITINRG